MKLYHWLEMRLANFMNHFSMRSRILFIVLFPVFWLVLDSYIEFRDVAHEGELGETKAVEAIAIETRTLIGIEFYERYRDMKGLSINEGLWDQDQIRSEKVLNKFVKLFPDYDIVIYTDLSGNPIAANTLDSKGKPSHAEKLYQETFSNREWFKKIMAGKFTEEPKKKLTGVYFKDAYVDHHINDILEKDNHLVTSFSTFVKNGEGRPIGILHGKANFSWVEDVIYHVYENMVEEGMTTAHISLFNKEGKLLSDLDAHDKESTDPDSLFNRNFESGILQQDLKAYGKKFVALAETHLRHADFMVNEKKDLEQVVAYTPIEDSKFIDSIGWQVFVKVDAEELMGDLLAAEQRFIIGLCLVTITSFFFALMVARIFNMALKQTSETLSTSSLQINEGVLLLKDRTQSLSATVEAQSAAAEETSSAVHEIDSMSRRNVQKVTRAQELGAECNQASAQAETTTNELRKNMDLVKDSNHQLEKSVESTLEAMQGLVASVKEIASKTTLINEIVFQTKLLSFNASVEAARAGEHGKGFAVVAEEIGQLATSSGSASTEISEIVEKSLSEVSKIVEDSRTQLQSSLSQSDKVVAESYNSTAEVTKSLKSISDKMSELDQVIVEISAASTEQQEGVSEINEALSKMTDGNHQVQQDVSSNKEFVSDFLQLVEKLKSEAGVMQSLVEGRRNSPDAKVDSPQEDNFVEDEDFRSVA